MVLVLGDAGDTHFDWRSSLEQDRSGKHSGAAAEDI